MSSPADMGEGDSRPYFFLSYARSYDRTPRRRLSSADPDRWVLRLFDDLCDAVQALTDADGAIGFMDRSTGQDDQWTEQLSRELARCRVFVPLYSPRYFNSASCGQQWHAFAQRRSLALRPSGQSTTGIVPVLWVPTDRYGLPNVAAELQFEHRAFGAEYASDGLYALMRLSRYQTEYEQAVYRLARRIVDVAEESAIPIAKPLDLESLPSAFRRGAGDADVIRAGAVLRRTPALRGEVGIAEPVSDQRARSVRNGPDEPIDSPDVINRLAEGVARLREYSPPELDDAAETVNTGIAEMFVRIGPPPSPTASGTGPPGPGGVDGNGEGGTPVGAGHGTGGSRRG
ncbi:TIR-like protein FxsC [Kitasatospora sp. NPDC001539]|uniref:TIR-like protein FxsC n=1 Tax=Kitasatospora sp. NPDC001539 TaxID=3154384 RepID=UPI00331C358B